MGNPGKLCGCCRAEPVTWPVFYSLGSAVLAKEFLIASPPLLVVFSNSRQFTASFPCCASLSVGLLCDSIICWWALILTLLGCFICASKPENQSIFPLLLQRAAIPPNSPSLFAPLSTPTSSRSQPCLLPVSACGPSAHILNMAPT